MITRKFKELTIRDAFMFAAVMSDPEICRKMCIRDRGGYLYWMSYMPDNFPKSLTAVYPILYNYSYLLAEGIITVIIISVPAVSKALIQVKRAALQ